MILQYKNTNVETACRMLDVTDSMIREWSFGEVKTMTGDKDSDEDLYSEKLFKKPEDLSMAMGHIELPIPVVNINHFLGTRPQLSMVLNMENKDIEKIVYFAKYVLFLDTKNHKCGDLIGEAELNEMLDKGELEPEDLSNGAVMTGAEAIEYMLETDGVPEREKYILHIVPVIPISLRARTNGDRLSVLGASIHYMKILSRMDRLKKLKNIYESNGTSSNPLKNLIVRNEMRLLQEAVDGLINNGVRGMPYYYSDGAPTESLYEIYDTIHNEVSELEKAINIDEWSILKGTVLDSKDGRSEFVKDAMAYVNSLDMESVNASDESYETIHDGQENAADSLYTNYFKTPAEKIYRMFGYAGEVGDLPKRSVIFACESWAENNKQENREIDDNDVKKFVGHTVICMSAYINCCMSKKMPEISA